jgi:hypothetical protein
VEDNVNVDVEGNDHVGVDAMPETSRKHTRHDRPRKTKVVQPIDEVVKELLSDFEITDGGDKDLFYNFDEVRKEKDGTANWCNINEKGAEFGDQESDDESDGPTSLQGSNSDNVGKRKKWHRQFNENMA